MRGTDEVFPLVLEEVSFRAKDRSIIDRVSLAMDRDVRTVILGPNGAGKSVLMRLMHGLLQPSSGRIAWCGREERPEAQAMVFQRPVVLRTTALRNVAYGLKLAGVPRTERAARGAAALERVGLSHLAGRPAKVFSGGEQQRLALARAWALEPRILFLDEPTASLDPNAARDVERIIGEIAATGCKIVMTTHNLGQARRLADEIVFLDSGRVAEYTPANVFFRCPRSAEADAFIRGELA
ncbi:MAG TPA: ATP-binding cassette domain-containing protein [Burkholderiales bacterium]